MLLKFCISLITNEAKHLFMFTGHFHLFFYKMLSYPLPIFYFFAIIGYRNCLYIMANRLSYMWQIRSWRNSKLLVVYLVLALTDLMHFCGAGTAA